MHLTSQYTVPYFTCDVTVFSYFNIKTNCCLLSIILERNLNAHLHETLQQSTT
jgi:hypothetical protein